MENTHSGSEGTKPEVIDIVELENHAKTKGTAAPPAKQYAFRVDKDRVVVDEPLIKGREILAKVGKTPELFKLYKHMRGNQPILVGADDTVDLREPGLERFTTMARDTTEGLESAPLRRQFRLPEANEAYLDGLGLPWETVKDGNNWLIIHKWKVPAGYNYDTVTLALLIPPNYSDTQIDMVYFKEHLGRKDGRAIGALATQTICGTAWQRWSRHRTDQNPWRKGVDDVASHLSLVDEWLRREFELKK
jgi:hypothetical protein